MEKKAGIWIDTKKEFIVFLEDDLHRTHTVLSEIESRLRIPGEGKWFTRFANQYLNFEKRKGNRRAEQLKSYLRNVSNAVRDAGQLVIFGPSGMKKELEKWIRNDTTIKSSLKDVVSADSMTDNQAIAWVRRYFRENPDF